MTHLAGNMLIGAGLLICVAGTLCFIAAKSFKERLLLCSVIDSCGFLTFCAGLALRSGDAVSVLKIVLILVTAFAVNPGTANKIAYSAFYRDGVQEEKEDDDSV